MNDYSFFTDGNPTTLQEQVDPYAPYDTPPQPDFSNFFMNVNFPTNLRISLADQSETASALAKEEFSESSDTLLRLMEDDNIITPMLPDGNPTNTTVPPLPLVTSQSFATEASPVSANSTFTHPQVIEQKSNAQATKGKKLSAKDELIYLRNRMQLLQTQLGELKNRKCRKRTKWEAAARSEGEKRFKAEQENLELKESLEEQLKYAESIQNLLKTQSNPQAIKDSSWKLYELSDDPITRIADMKNIVDREYEKLSSVLIDAGLYDVDDAFQVMRMSGDLGVVDKSKLMEFEIARCCTFSGVSHSSVAESFWKVWSGIEETIGVAGDGISAIEEIDENLCYVKFICTLLCKFSGSPRIGTIVMRRYIEPDKVVIVWRSIMEDPLLEVPENTLRCNDNGWLVVEKLPGENSAAEQTRVRFVLKVRPPKLINTTSQQPTGAITESIMTSLLHNTNRITDIVDGMVADANSQNENYSINQMKWKMLLADPGSSPALGSAATN